MPTSAKATAPRRAGGFGWCGCGGGPTGSRRIGRQDGWCEDPQHRLYNRPIRVPDIATGDRLWRQDRLYDLIIELDHNSRPRVAGRGSAVFIHVAREGFKPTAGCVALTAPRLQRLLERVGPNTRIVIA